MTLQYQPSEITLPSGITPESMKWVLVSWDLACVHGANKFYHVVVGPGTFTARYGSRGPNVFKMPPSTLGGNVAGQYNTWNYPTVRSTATAQAIKKTKEKERGKYEFVCKPFAVDLSQTKIPGSVETIVDKFASSFETAGDLIDYKNPSVMVDIFRILFAEREARRSTHEVQKFSPNLWEGR